MIAEHRPIIDELRRRILERWRRAGEWERSVIQVNAVRVEFSEERRGKCCRCLCNLEESGIEKTERGHDGHHSSILPIVFAADTLMPKEYQRG